MEQIKLTGTQIIDTDRMKKSGTFRVTFELTKDDATKFCGALAIAENSELLANLTINFTEIQGNNNGYEVTTLVGKGSIYQRFKRFCDEHGIDYIKQKEELGVIHLFQLEEKYPIEEVEEMLKERMRNLEIKLGLYS